MKTTRTGSRFAAAGLLGAVALAPVTAGAGGLYLPGIGPTAQSRGGAFVAKADDPSAIGVNPAGLAKGEGTVIFVGANLVDYSLDFTRRGTYDDADNVDLAWEGQPYATVSDQSKPAIGVGPFQAVPLIAVSTDLGLNIEGLRFGVGLIAPTAYPTREFAADYDIDPATGEPPPGVPPPPTRYDTVTQEAAVVLPSIAVAYRVNDKLDIGARFSAGVGDIKAKVFVWGELNYEELAANDAIFIVKAQDKFVPAYGFGVLYRPVEHLELGFNFDSQVNVHAKGTGDSVTGVGTWVDPDEPVIIEPVSPQFAKCAPGGEVGALKACVDIGLPMVATFGARYELLDGKADVELDVAYERWTPVSDYTVVVDGIALNSLQLARTYITHGAKDVISTRLGGGYQLPVGRNALALRAGVAYDTAGVRDGWERVDFDGAARHTVAAGVSYVMPKIAFQLGGGFVHEGSREVGTDCNPMTVGDGCAEDGGEQGLADRDGPDPAQPLNAGDPFESPFNAGTYRSQYVLLHVGVTYKF